MRKQMFDLGNGYNVIIKNRIDYLIQEDEDNLYFKILDMNEKFRKERYLEFHDKNKNSVNTFCCPYLFLYPSGHYEIALRGHSKLNDYNVAKCSKNNFNMDMVINLLDDWAKNWEGWSIWHRIKAFFRKVVND